MKLKEYRILKEMSQSQMAKELGVSKDVYISWEYRKRIPRLKSMQKIVEYTIGYVRPEDFYESEA